MSRGDMCGGVGGSAVSGGGMGVVIMGCGCAGGGGAAH